VQQQIEKLRDRVLGELERLSSTQEIQQLRARALGKKGELTEVLKNIGSLTPAERPKMGQFVNRAKSLLEESFEKRLKEIAQRDLSTRLTKEQFDLTLPGRRIPSGHSHPISLTLDKMLSIFTELGFDVILGPDIESDFYNFQALNIPKEHPARDMQDTFWLDDDLLLRTHTSPVQIRTMEKEKPPIRMVAPGAVFRCDSDITHSPMFHQVEGLMVDQEISMGDLKGVLSLFLRKLFGEKTDIRFRPSFFPFTEPSCEVDIQCVFCRGKGCRVCGQSGWLEILGAGLVDPEVFRIVKYPKDCSGFAFGIGIERVAMLHSAKRFFNKRKAGNRTGRIRVSGRVTGIFSKPKCLTTSSTKSMGRVKSTRKEGTCHFCECFDVAFFCRPKAFKILLTLSGLTAIPRRFFKNSKLRSIRGWRGSFPFLVITLCTLGFLAPPLTVQV